MANKQKDESVKTTKKSERYLHMLFSFLKKREGIVLSEKMTHFNNTEIRLISEILSAKYEGKRLISTQLANLLGITRSAVSQIVNHLEDRGIVKRVADEVDRKIAYIEITDKTMELYGEDLKNCLVFIDRVVKKFGEERFEQMYDLVDEFVCLIEKEKDEVKKK